MLQQRQKWIKPHRNFVVGDIVLVKDDNLLWNQWKLARVKEILPSDDGGFIRKAILVVGTTTLDKFGRRSSIFGAAHSQIGVNSTTRPGIPHRGA